MVVFPGQCKFYIRGQESLDSRPGEEYQTCTSPYPFDTLVTVNVTGMGCTADKKTGCPPFHQCEVIEILYSTKPSITGFVTKSQNHAI